MRSPASVTCLVLLAGCGGDGTLDWHVGFETDALRARADVVVAELLRGGCDGEVEASYGVRSDGSVGSDPVSTIKPGPWGLRARALDRFCVQYAEICTLASIEARAQSVELNLVAATEETAQCPLAECFNGECRPSADAGAGDVAGDWVLETLSDIEHAEPVAGTASPAQPVAPSLAIDDENTVHAFWEDGTRFLYSARSDTEWTTTPLSAEAQTNPSLALKHFGGQLHFALASDDGSVSYASFAVGAPEDWDPNPIVSLRTYNVTLSLTPTGEPVVVGCLIGSVRTRILVGSEWIDQGQLTIPGTIREACVASVTDEHFYIGVTQNMGSVLQLADRERSGTDDWRLRAVTTDSPRDFRLDAARLSETVALIVYGGDDRGVLLRVDPTSLSAAPFEAERAVGKLAVEVDSAGKPVVAFVTPDEGIFLADGTGLELVAAGDFPGVSLALDSSDAPHIVFFDGTHPTYARRE